MTGKLNKPQNTQCEDCGDRFQCDIQAGKKICWCFDLPNLLPLDSSLSDTSSQHKAGCYCPKCLEARIDNAKRALK